MKLKIVDTKEALLYWKGVYILYGKIFTQEEWELRPPSTDGWNGDIHGHPLGDDLKRWIQEINRYEYKFTEQFLKDIENV